jgi:chemotaxis protein MotB
MTDTDALLERLEGRTMLGTSEIPQVIAALRELRKQDRISSLLIRRLSGEASDFAEKLWAAEAERDDLRAQLATIKAAAEDATEYVLALENKRLREQLAAYEEADTSDQPYDKGWQDGRADAWAAYQAQIARERAARDEFEERNRNQADIIKSLRAELRRDKSGSGRVYALPGEVVIAAKDLNALSSAVDKLRVQHSAEVALLNADKDALRAEAETHFASLQREWKLVDELQTQLWAARKENTELRWDGALNEAEAEIKRLREQLEAARTMLRAASTELRKLKMTATADCIDAALAAVEGK